MTAGPGKYDDECTAVLEKTNAVATLLVVLDGDRGTGFSLTARDPTVILNLPDALEEIAAQIRSDLRKVGN